MVIFTLDYAQGRKFKSDQYHRTNKFLRISDPLVPYTILSDKVEEL